MQIKKFKFVSFNLLLIGLCSLFAYSCVKEMPGKEEIKFFELGSGPPKQIDFRKDNFELRGKTLTLIFPPIWHNKDIDLFLCMKNRVCFMWQSLLTTPNGQLNSSLTIPKKKINVELKILLKFNENKSFEYFFPLTNVK